jgi:hypothetical protein
MFKILILLAIVGAMVAGCAQPVGSRYNVDATKVDAANNFSAGISQVTAGETQGTKTTRTESLDAEGKPVTVIETVRGPRPGGTTAAHGAASQKQTSLVVPTSQGDIVIDSVSSNGANRTITFGFLGSQVVMDTQDDIMIEAAEVYEKGELIAKGVKISSIASTATAASGNAWYSLVEVYKKYTEEARAGNDAQLKAFEAAFQATVPEVLQLLRATVTGPVVFP